MYFGYDDLVACEIAFYKNQLDSARIHANQAVLKAREKKQYGVEMMASMYLLRIAICEGDYALSKEMLRQMHEHLDNPDFWNRQLLYDLFTGMFHIQIGMPDLVPPWLVMNEMEATTEVRIPTRELTVCVRSCLASKEYSRALAVLSNSYPRAPEDRFLLGELIISLLTAVARLKTDDVSGAMEDFERAYSLSFEGVFEMPFVEIGKELHPLVVAASKQANPGIPIDWLKMIDRKASIYAKKAAVIRNSYKIEKNIEDNVALSNREQEILTDLYHGLTREEIAENRYLSLPTVKKILESIYIKLDANNVADALRIAIKNKLISD